MAANPWPLPHATLLSSENETGFRYSSFLPKGWWPLWCTSSEAILAELTCHTWHCWSVDVRDGFWMFWCCGFLSRCDRFSKYTSSQLFLLHSFKPIWAVDQPQTLLPELASSSFRETKHDLLRSKPSLQNLANLNALTYTRMLPTFSIHIRHLVKCRALLIFPHGKWEAWVFKNNRTHKKSTHAYLTLIPYAHKIHNS